MAAVDGELTDTSFAPSPRRRRRRRRRAWASAVACCFGQPLLAQAQAAVLSSCLVDVDRALLAADGSRPGHSWPRLAFASLRMTSSLRQGRKRQRSSCSKKLSSLSSTPFPAATSGRSKSKPKRPTTHRNATEWPSDMITGDEYQGDEGSSSSYVRQGPFPAMPSPLFANLAQSQFELLSNSLVHAAILNDDGGGGDATNKDETKNGGIRPGTPKISSMALYLPKENPNTGQLEFVPAVTYPDPSSGRVFIASDASNGGTHQPPAIPSAGVLGLPGFFKARDLIPTYPFVSSASEAADDGNGAFTTASPDNPISVSVADEVSTPNSPSGPTSLSVTLFSGLDTLGVLMIWPYRSAEESRNKWKWTPNDKLQVTRAAKSLALALSMDNERASTQLANEQFRVAMADGLHQVKSPLQALRTFGKLLQRQLAEENAEGRDGPVVMERVPASARRRQQALKLAEDMVSQGERVVDLIGPMDSLVHGDRLLLRGDVGKGSTSSALILQPSNSDALETPQQLQLPPSLPMLGDFELEMAFPQDVLGSIVYASQAISREKGINFDAVGFEPDNMELPGVTVCPRHLKEAASNLLDNAIKYVTCRRKGKKGRPRTPQIRVTLASNEPPLSPGATLYVEDNGPGIPESERDKVFERGYRGETVQEEVSGSGLGLAIAREMVSRQGGMLDLLEGDGPSKLDGTTFRIILFRDPEFT